MKRLFVLLLAANLALGAWLLLGDPVDMVREPARMALQIDPGRFHVLSDADAARLRTQADAAAAAGAAAAAAAPAPDSAPDDAAKAASDKSASDRSANDKAGADSPDAARPDAPRADRAAADSAHAEPAGAPSPGCIELGDFASESAARKARARLAEIGPEEHLSLSTSDKSTRLRMTGVDAALELKIQRVLKDFPRQRLSHCSDPAAAR
jgi:hypothetical protein